MYKKIIDLIEKAQCPVVLAGQGVELSGAKGKLWHFITDFYLPTMTSFCGMALVPSDNHLYAGHYGTIGTPYANYLVKQSDLVLCIGTRNNLRQIGYSWNSKAKWIIVDIDKSELQKPTIKPYITIHQDAGTFIQGMIDSQNGVNPYAWARELSQSLPNDAVVVCGNGMACVAYFHAGVVKDGQKIIMNSGCASMGYDLPAAIGAYFATGKRITCIAGDGSIQMNIQELQTIKHHKIPIDIYVLNNGGYASIRQTQRHYFGHFVGCDKVDVSFPDMAKIGKAYGVKINIINLSEQVIRKGVL